MNINYYDNTYVNDSISNIFLAFQFVTQETRRH